MFLLSVVSFYKKTFISLSIITKPSLKNISLIIVGFHLNPKSYPSIIQDVFSLGFWCKLKAIQYASRHFQNWSTPMPHHYENHAQKNLYQLKQKGYLVQNLGRSNSKSVWWKHSISVGTTEITYKEKTLNKTLSNVYSFRKKFQTCIPKEFETFHFTRTAVCVLNKKEEFKSALHCRVYYCLFKKKMIKIKI